MAHRTINIPRGQDWDIGNYQVLTGDTLTVRAPTSASALVNHGTVWDSGTLDVRTNLSQVGSNGNSQIDVIQNGKLVLGGATDGGIIAVESGMLELDRSPTFHQPAVGSYAARNFHSGLAFSGSDAVVKFDGVGQISVTYRPDFRDLLISATYHHQQVQVADMHLIGNSNPYSAGEFTAKGNELVYHIIRI